MNPRIRRLHADFEQVAEVFGPQHPLIRMSSCEGAPPEKYAFLINVNGLVLQPNGSIIVSRPHSAEVFLPLDYPRRPPVCRMTSPVFHPNIDPQKICIGDHWSAGQRLVDLVVRIAEMICFQSYNVKSPLNAAAAAWAEQHIGELPLQRGDLGAGR